MLISTIQHKDSFIYILHMSVYTHTHTHTHTFFIFFPIMIYHRVVTNPGSDVICRVSDAMKAYTVGVMSYTMDMML